MTRRGETKNSMIVGLTGNIACGKSTVAQMLRTLGLPVVDADQVARDVVLPGGPTLAEIAREFGAEILLADGSLDRAALRLRVFQDEAKRRRLEQILHPAIAARSREQFQKHLSAGAKLVIYEATLLFEAGRQSDFDGVLVVTCEHPAQKSRVLARDKTLSSELADQIIGAQMPQAEKVRLATWVIKNDGSVEDLQAKVKAWLKTVQPTS